MANNITRTFTFFLRGLLAILLGVVLLVRPDWAAKYAVVVIGAMLLVIGLIVTIDYFRRPGLRTFPWSLVVAALGIVLMIIPQTFSTLLVIMLGVIIIVGAIDQFAMIARGHKAGLRISMLSYLIPALLLIAGVIMCIYAGRIFELAFVIFGVVAIVYGLIDIFNQYQLRH